MIKKIYVLTGLLMMSNVLMAQNQELAIKGTIETFFKAMYARDSTLMKTVMHPNSTLNSVNISPGKDSKLDQTPLTGFYKAIANIKADLKIEERLLDHKILIDEDLATDWTPYEFYVNDKLSHKGTNVFTLVKLKGQWLITAIIDTRKR